MLTDVMIFYVSKDKLGNIHVQNMIGPYQGQHHVHTKEDYKRWLRQSRIPKELIRRQKGECTCGLSPGRVRRLT